ncbi:MAG: formyltransferase family protein, partial [Pseudomonadota bacterium]
MTRLRLAIIISGRGSNMEAILKACEDVAYPAKPVLVVSNRPEAAGIAVANAYGV